MAEERAELGASDLARWLVIAIVVIAGIALYFWLSRDTTPVVGPLSTRMPA